MHQAMAARETEGQNLLSDKAGSFHRMAPFTTRGRCSQLHLSPSFHRAGKGYLIDKLQFTAHGQSVGNPGDLHSQGL